jgi:hypothetical protein
MKLEYVKDINGYDEHAIRLSDFDSSQANKFREVINLIIDTKTSIELTSHDFIELLNIKLTLRVAEEDLGITTTDYVDFFCDLTIDSYKNIATLLEPFCRKESRGYQWLYDIDTPIGFLFSAGGRW